MFQTLNVNRINLPMNYFCCYCYLLFQLKQRVCKTCLNTENHFTHRVRRITICMMHVKSCLVYDVKLNNFRHHWLKIGEQYFKWRILPFFLWLYISTVMSWLEFVIYFDICVCVMCTDGQYCLMYIENKLKK